MVFVYLFSLFVFMYLFILVRLSMYFIVYLIIYLIAYLFMTHLFIYRAFLHLFNRSRHSPVGPTASAGSSGRTVGGGK